MMGAELADEHSFGADEVIAPVVSLCSIPKSLSNAAWSSASVESALTRIAGSPPTQRELISMRTTIFKEVLPGPTREEKRSRAANLRQFERHMGIVIPMLAQSLVTATVLNMCYSLRNQPNQEKLLMHVLRC
jgi:hypothetical protein